MAMGRNIRVFHNPNVQPYSVLIEQRGVDSFLLLESQAILQLGLEEGEKIKSGYTKLCDAYGVLGNMRLSAGERVLHYLGLVTGCVSCGKLGAGEVYRLTDCKMISLRGYQPDEELGKVVEVRKLLSSGGSYFSWSSQGPAQAMDLTMSAQKQHRFPSKSDGRFFWNRMLHLPYVRAGVDTGSWLLRVMVGSVEIRTVYVGSRQARAVIISRLSSERAGTRFCVRGVDDDGHVANFVETEQLIMVEESCTSFIQVRGSVPLFWEQPGVNVGSHKIRISRGPELSAPAFDSHFKQLKALYGDIIIINLLGSNLVGSKEGEATLSTAFQTHQKSSTHTDIPHILWDFHSEGGQKSLDKLDRKVSKYAEKLDFYHKAGKSVPKKQTGVIRSNCTDCLDRTNAVQSFIGLKILTHMLARMKLDEKENIVSRFEDGFKQMWINNGNALSKLYAGTGALSQGGSKLLDGARSVSRTIQNNLLDKDKQEAYDLLLLGTGWQSDLADRTRLYLPINYWNAPVPLCQSAIKKYEEFTHSEPLRVAIGTYNINGGKHFRSVVYKNVSLDDWLLDPHKQNKETLVDVDEPPKDDKPIDIYAIGFEEMVDLDAKNIMNASKENAKEWALELSKTLSRDRSYCMVTFHQLVGVCLYVFVRSELASQIRDVCVEDVKTGMGGATGNKGTVAISITYKATSMVFLCSHFAAGQKEIQERNNDFGEAIKKLAFANGRSVLSHDYVFWCGDFNYRINMARDEVKDLVAKQDWTELTAADQLQCERSANNVFQGFTEGPITFAPTYKYDLFSDDFDTSEKARVPAWTDRVLWKRRKPPTGQTVPQTEPSLVFYGRAELKQSDHRPVIALLDVQARAVDKERRDKALDTIGEELGPSDGTVIVTPCTGTWAVSLATIGGNIEEVVGAVNSEMSKFGSVRYSRAVRDSVWTQYREGGAALTALTARNISVMGVDWEISSCTRDWRCSLATELALVSNPVLPLAPPPGSQFKKDSAKLLSQLSQLSFEELNDITLNLDVAPVKPPPPRPAAPPSRPPPPSRPSEEPPKPSEEPPKPSDSPAKPARPGPPPRPKPPPARPQPPRPPPEKVPSPDPEPVPPTPADPPANVESEEAPAVPKSGGGFSDLFSAPPDPDLATDIPLSLSSDSLAMASGEATPAPTRPPLPSVDPELGVDLAPRGSVDSGLSLPRAASPPAESESESSDSESDTESGNSTPTNEDKDMKPPKLPSRPTPPSRPLPGPPSRPPPGTPPRIPGRPGAPPPVPRR